MKSLFCPTSKILIVSQFQYCLKAPNIFCYSKYSLISALCKIKEQKQSKLRASKIWLLQSRGFGYNKEILDQNKTDTQQSKHPILYLHLLCQSFLQHAILFWACSISCIYFSLVLLYCSDNFNIWGYAFHFHSSMQWTLSPSMPLNTFLQKRHWHMLFGLSDSMKPKGQNRWLLHSCVH